MKSYGALLAPAFTYTPRIISLSLSYLGHYYELHMVATPRKITHLWVKAVLKGWCIQWVARVFRNLYINTRKFFAGSWIKEVHNWCLVFKNILIPLLLSHYEIWQYLSNLFFSWAWTNPLYLPHCYSSTGDQFSYCTSNGVAKTKMRDCPPPPFSIFHQTSKHFHFLNISLKLHHFLKLLSFLPSQTDQQSV